MPCPCCLCLIAILSKYERQVFTGAHIIINDEDALFLVHLSLKYRHRHFQLRHLYELVEQSEKPVIVAGDFNTFWGENEIYLFMKATGLRSANVESLPSYPSRAPRMELDFILYGAGIEVTHFEIPPDIGFSDHLPLICDFEVTDRK